jgi:hypothetical protein
LTQISQKPTEPGADPGFEVRGGALKKVAPSRGRSKIFGVFRVKNHGSSADEKKLLIYQYSKIS